MGTVSKGERLWQAARALSDAVERLSFAAPVTHVYNPLVYAAATHRQYLEKYGNSPKKVIFWGMNPGPWGMAQTGVPFGDPPLCRGWLAIEGDVGKPPKEHDKRRIVGLNSSRSEVSGTRLWGAVQEHFATPKAFFAERFVANYCPLCFMEESGRNRTPDRLPKAEREPLFAACDEHMREVVELLRPSLVVGVGAFAAKRAKVALKGNEVTIGQVLHPSPASPAANRDWAGTVRRQLAELGVCSGD